MRKAFAKATGIFTLLAAAGTGFAFTTVVTAVRVYNGNTFLTSHDEIVHVIGETAGNKLYLFTTVEPRATEFARSVIESNNVTLAYRGRNSDGVRFAIVLIGGTSYATLLEERGLLSTKSPEAFSSEVVKTIDTPWRFPHKVVSYKQSQPSVLGELFRYMADDLQSQKLPGRSAYERDINRYVNQASREYRRMAAVYDKPFSDMSSSDLRQLYRSADTIETIPGKMIERNTEEIIKRLDLDQ